MLAKVLKGTLIAGAGAGLSYLVAVDWSNLGPVYAAVAASLVNVLWQGYRAYVQKS